MQLLCISFPELSPLMGEAPTKWDFHLAVWWPPKPKRSLPVVGKERKGLGEKTEDRNLLTRYSVYSELQHISGYHHGDSWDGSKMEKTPRPVCKQHHNTIETVLWAAPPSQGSIVLQCAQSRADSCSLSWTPWHTLNEGCRYTPGCW